MFNYASFCKVLSLENIYNNIKRLLKNQPSISSGHIESRANIVERELHKLFMNQISSLKKLTYRSSSYKTFTIYPEAKDCLGNLSELNCSSYINSEFFYQLSHVCHNLQILYITFVRDIS